MYNFFFIPRCIVKAVKDKIPQKRFDYDFITLHCINYLRFIYIYMFTPSMYTYVFIIYVNFISGKKYLIIEEKCSSCTIMLKLINHKQKYLCLNTQLTVGAVFRS